MGKPVIITNPFVYWLEAVKGNIKGLEAINVQGRHPGLTLDTEETVWDQGGDLIYLTGDTQLYASSTSASDSGVTLIVEGLDENYQQIVRTVTLTGQSQEALDDLMYRVYNAYVTGTQTPVGDIYIAETDSLTDGVPDTASKIKTKIIAGNGRSNNAIFTVPAGKTAYGVGVIFIAGKGDDIVFRPRVRTASNGVWVDAGEFQLYQQAVVLPLEGIEAYEYADVEYRAIAGNADARATIFLYFYLIDN